MGGNGVVVVVVVVVHFLLWWRIVGVMLLLLVLLVAGLVMGVVALWVVVVVGGVRAVLVVHLGVRLSTAAAAAVPASHVGGTLLRRVGDVPFHVGVGRGVRGRQTPAAANHCIAVDLALSPSIFISRPRAALGDHFKISSRGGRLKVNRSAAPALGGLHAGCPALGRVVDDVIKGHIRRRSSF